jgi:signal transduction histidine kinase|tara:strand:- start:108882 stop:109364 length:483 start_codon:yes stop_codon:yes gene_type:complete
MIETDSIPYNRELLSILSECQRSISVLQTTLEPKGVTLSCEIEPELYVRADREMFDAVVRNPVSNAVKFTPAGGTIILKARREHSGIRMSIQDTGIGMSEQSRRKLFSDDLSVSFAPNGETDNARGFQLVRKFVKIQEGRIEVCSTLGCGTIVSFSLPSG